MRLETFYTNIVLASLQVGYPGAYTRASCFLGWVAEQFGLKAAYTEANRWAAHYILHTTNCTLHTAHCILHTTYCTVYCTQHTARYILHTTICTLQTVHHKLHIVHSTLFNVHCTLHRVHNALYNAHCTLYTVHCTAVQPDPQAQWLEHRLSQWGQQQEESSQGQVGLAHCQSVKGRVQKNIESVSMLIPRGERGGHYGH